MKPTETIMRNEAIATMLGYRQIKNLEEITEENKHLAESWFYPDAAEFMYRESDELKYHRDWNWLMAAVEFIEKLNIFKEKYSCYVEIGEFDCQIECCGKLKSGEIFDFSGVIDMGVKIDSVFICVSDFAIAVK